MSTFLGFIKNKDEVKFHFNTNLGTGERTPFDSPINGADIKIRIYYRDSTEITATADSVASANPSTGGHRVLWTATKIKEGALIEFILDPVAAGDTVDGVRVHQVIATAIGCAKGSSALGGYVRLETPTVFDERTGLTSGTITAVGEPDYGVVFTGGGTPTNVDFDPDILQGAVLANLEAETTDDLVQYLPILGGYFFTTGANRTTKVFGIAKDPKFGIIEAGKSVFVDTNWAGTGLVEAGNGTGWTFITAPVGADDTKYPDSGNNLSIYINPASMRLPEVTVKGIEKTSPLYNPFVLGQLSFKCNSASFGAVSTQSEFSTDITYSATVARKYLGALMLITGRADGDGEPDIEDTNGEWRTIVKITEDDPPGGIIRFHLDKPLTFSPDTGSTSRGASSTGHFGVVWLNHTLPSMISGPRPIYIDGTNGDDGDGGLTEESPVKTMGQAKIMAKDGDHIIFLESPSDVAEVDFTQSQLKFSTKKIAGSAYLKVTGIRPKFINFRWSSISSQEIKLGAVEKATVINSYLKSGFFLMAPCDISILDNSRVDNIANDTGSPHTSGTLIVSNSWLEDLNTGDPPPEFDRLFFSNGSRFGGEFFSAHAAPTIIASDCFFENATNLGIYSGTIDSIFTNCTYKVLTDVYGSLFNGCQIKGGANFKGDVTVINCNLGAITINGTGIILKSNTLQSLTLGATAENCRFEGNDIDGTLTITAGAGLTTRNEFSNNVYQLLTNNEPSGTANVFDFDNRLWDQAAITAGLTQQQVRDAMKLSPTAGAPSADSIDFELQRLKDIIDLPFAFDFVDTFGTIGPVAIWFTTDAKTTPLLYAEILKSDNTTPANASEVAHRLSVKTAPIP